LKPRKRYFSSILPLRNSPALAADTSTVDIDVHCTDKVTVHTFLWSPLLTVRIRLWQMALRATGQWPLTEADEDEYNAHLEAGETSGEAKQDDLVYYLAVQPRHP
jgi:hypothetical protein